MSLALDAVTLTAGSVTILDQLSLKVEPGTLTVLLGPNGAGKSSVLRLLAGEIAPCAGTVRLDGEPLRRWDRCALARRRAVLPQHSDVAFNFTAFDVAALGRLPHGETPAAADAIARRALARICAGHLEDRLFPTLSGGERQRVQLARVLAQIWPIEEKSPDAAPRYLLLDEPTSALDPKHQLDMLVLAQEITAQGHGVLAILHDFNQASAFADHIIVLREGRLVAQGRPEVVLTAAIIRSVWGMDVDILHPHGPARPVVVPCCPMQKNERAGVAAFS